ncbi:hypothetical protein MBRA_06332 [Methylobacterium brachiatum]|nr:hypothetical protein MBRA_06332 [Methylobacterium brachiatum]
MIHASIPPLELSHLIAAGQPHFRPVYAAMRSSGVALLLVRQGHGRFDVPKLSRGRGFVAVIGDDMDRADGPSGFRRKSLRRLLGAVGGVSLISCEILPDVYATAAQLAAFGQNVAIIETRPEQEGAWLDFLKEVAPRANLLICTAAAGTA